MNMNKRVTLFTDDIPKWGQSESATAEGREICAGVHAVSRDNRLTDTGDDVHAQVEFVISTIDILGRLPTRVRYNDYDYRVSGVYVGARRAVISVE